LEAVKKVAKVAKTCPTDEYWERSITETKLLTKCYMNLLEKSTKSTIIVWVYMVGKTENILAFQSLW